MLVDEFTDPISLFSYKFWLVVLVVVFTDPVSFLGRVCCWVRVRSAGGKAAGPFVSLLLVRLRFLRFSPFSIASVDSAVFSGLWLATIVSSAAASVCGALNVDEKDSLLSDSIETERLR